MTTMTETKVYQSKWGYHPCDLETYKKLRKLNQWFMKAQREAAEWNRWARKDKQNRVIRKFIRNDQGQKIGCEIVGPKPEPVIDSPFCKIDLNDESCWRRFDWTRTPQTYRLRKHKLDGNTRIREEYCFYLTNLFVNSFGVDIDYNNAKRPVTEDAVTPLRNSVKEINNLYEKVFNLNS